MKKFFSIIALTFLFNLVSQAEDRIYMATHEGSWSEGTNGGFARVKFASDGVVAVTRYTYTNATFIYNETSFGKFTEGKTGLRTFVVATGTNSITGTALNGVVRGKTKNFVTKQTGAISCDVPAY